MGNCVCAKLVILDPPIEFIADPMRTEEANKWPSARSTKMYSIPEMHKLPTSRRIANGLGYGLGQAEKGLATYNTLRAGYAAGSAIAAAATPYLAAGAAIL